MLGVTKAYTTRVGDGPFPTELFDETGAHLASAGREFGATTGRNRRCGWFDAAAVRLATHINSISGLCLTKLDVLDTLDTLKVCIGYRGEGGELLGSSMDVENYGQLQPVYEELPGWRESTSGVRALDELPARARAYIRYIEQAVEVPVDIISTGADRDETIILRHPFDP